MADRSADQRRKSLRRGHVSEYLAALSLILRGYRILAMRYRVRAGEIDIIARKGDVVSFIEVKARADTERIAPLAADAERRRPALLVLRHRRRPPLALAGAFQGCVLNFHAS